ncbi:MAG: FeoB-associated Cys-rich membrane protein [Firmicutes bacterium]|nr:FeoB-associated Cys-rich membrane protein [Bacillota bacterium]
MDAIDIILIIAIVLCFGSAVRKVIKIKKNGGCGCSCRDCAKDCPSRREDE